MNNDWAALARQYLVRSEPVLMEQAIAAAREQEIVALLRAFLQKNFETTNYLATVLYESLQRVGRIEEAFTVALLPTDLQTRLVEFYNRFPLEQQAQLLQLGLEACEEAMLLATQLDDLPCV